MYDKLQQQIKHLKEDKFLVNLVNGKSWVNPEDPTNQAFNSVAIAELNASDRRSLRKRELAGRFSVGKQQTCLMVVVVLDLPIMFRRFIMAGTHRQEKEEEYMPPGIVQMMK